MQEAFQFTAVHVDVLDELDVVHVYVILRADGQLLQPAGHQRDQIHSFLPPNHKGSYVPGGDAAEDSVEVAAAQREQNPTG